MKKNSKTVLALITGVLFLTLATIPVTLFSQAQQEEGRAVWLHASIFEDEEKEATQHLKELLNKYDIDGIHLDYIRFPVNQRFSYDKATCESFKKEYGYSPLEVKHDCGSMVWSEWIKWNAKHVTALIKEIKETINKSGRNVVLGVDVFPDHVTAQVLIGQDWELWAKEGIVDFICPMLYTNNTDLFRRFVKEAVKAADGKCLVYPGIACRSSHNKNTPEGVAQEVKIAREAGADGVVFFSGFSLNEEFINKLKFEVFKEE